MIDKNLCLARGIYYRLFALSLGFVQNEEEFSQISQIIKHLKDFPFDENSKNSLLFLHQFCQNEGLQGFKNEQNRVLFSPISSFVPMSASYYDEQRDDGKKRLEVIEFLKKAKLGKEDFCKNSEDELSFIFAIMNKLLEESLSENAQALKLENEFFANIINPFADEFAARLKNHQNGYFYKHLAMLFEIFIFSERLYFNLK